MTLKIQGTKISKTAFSKRSVESNIFVDVIQTDGNDINETPGRFRRLYKAQSTGTRWTTPLKQSTRRGIQEPQVR